MNENLTSASQHGSLDFKNLGMFINLTRADIRLQNHAAKQVLADQNHETFTLHRVEVTAESSTIVRTADMLL